MDKKSIPIKIELFETQLVMVEDAINIPANTIRNLTKGDFSASSFNNFKTLVADFILIFGKCQHLMCSTPMLTQKYSEIERKYCQMIFLVKMVFQKAGLEHEFKQAVAKANEELKLWRKEQQSPKTGQHNESVNYQDNRNANFNAT